MRIKDPLSIWSAAASAGVGALLLSQVGAEAEAGASPHLVIATAVSSNCSDPQLERCVVRVRLDLDQRAAFKLRWIYQR